MKTIKRRMKQEEEKKKQKKNFSVSPFKGFPT
jgi:hypothetical protein